MTLKFKWETEFKQTEIGEIPREWEEKRVEEFYKLMYGITTSSKGYGNCRLLRMTDIGEEDINIETIPYAKIDEQELKKYYLDEDDLVISRIANVGAIGHIRGDLLQKLDKPLIFGSYLLKFVKQPGKQISNRFVYYFFISHPMQTFIESLAEGSTRPNTNAKVVSKFPLYYPPPPEQSSIATVLSWFDDLIENKKRQNEILEKVAMAIFKSWFVDFEPFKDEEFVHNEELGKEIPEGWKIEKLKELTENITSGRGRYIIKAKEGRYPLWGANGILGFINEYDLEGFAILTGRVGTLGKVFLVNDKFTISDNVLTLIPKKTIYIFFIYLCMKTQIDFESLNVGSTQPLITKTALGDENVILPPQPILQHFHSLVEPLFQKITLNQKQIMVLRKIRDALLPKLVFGRLRVEEI